MNVTYKQVEAALKQLPFFDYPTTLQPYVIRHIIEEARQVVQELQQKREPLSDDELNSLRQRANGKLNFVILLSLERLPRQ